MTDRKPKAAKTPPEPEAHPDAAEPIVVFNARGGPVDAPPVLPGETGCDFVVPPAPDTTGTEAATSEGDAK